MKSTITWVGGRAPSVRKTPTPSQGFRGPLQLANLALEILDPIAFRRCGATTFAAIAFSAPDPLAQPIRCTAHLLCDRADRSPLRRMLFRMLHHQPDSSLSNLRRVPAPLSYVRILSSFRASGKAGSIHYYRLPA